MGVMEGISLEGKRGSGVEKGTGERKAGTVVWDMAMAVVGSACIKTRYVFLKVMMKHITVYANLKNII